MPRNLQSFSLSFLPDSKLMKQIRQNRKDFEDQLLVEYAATQLRQLQRICTTLADEEELLSGKVLKLVDVLKKYGEQEGK